MEVFDGFASEDGVGFDTIFEYIGISYGEVFDGGDVGSEQHAIDVGSRKGFLVDDRTDIYFLSQFDVAALFDHGNGLGDIEQSFGRERCDDVGLCVFGGSHKDISFADAFIVEETQIAGIATIHLVFGMGDGTMYGFLFIRISLHDPRTDVFRE